MTDFTRVDWQSLRAARQKMRTVIVQLEQGKRPHNDILHPAYKLSQFLSEALPDAWAAAEIRAPDAPPGQQEPSEDLHERGFGRDESPGGSPSG